MGSHLAAGWVNEAAPKDHAPGPQAARIWQVTERCQAAVFTLYAGIRQLVQLIIALKTLRSSLAGTLLDDPPVVVKGTDVEPVTESIKLTLWSGL